MAIAPTIFAGIRLQRSTFVYDDLEHPDRPSGTIASPAYVTEDHALLLGLEMYETSLCQGCGFPKHLAWHSHMDGWFDGHEVKCHACTAMKAESSTGPTKPVVYQYAVDTRPVDERDLPPFALGVTTTAT